MVAFEEFYNSWYEKVYRYLLRHVTDPGTAEDLAGDVFVACYKSYESYDETKASLSTWLFVIANNRLKNYYRDRKEYASLDEIGEDAAGETPDTMGMALEQEENRKMIAKALLSLDERQQRAVVMKYFQDKSGREIAKAIGVSEANVRVILSRALVKMNRMLTGGGQADRA